MNVWSIATAAMLAATAAGAVQHATKAAPPAPNVTVIAKPVSQTAPLKPSIAVVTQPTKAKAVQAKPARALKPLTTTVIVQEPTRVAEIAPLTAVEAYAVAQVDEENQQRVSASFNKAAASEVLDWLTKNGVNFATADSELPKGETITLNVKDRPINEVLDAIASAMGGHWERRGGMRVFRKGAGFRFLSGEHGLAIPSEGAWNMAPGKTWTTEPGKMRAFRKDGEFKVFTPEGMKEFKLDMEKMKSLRKDGHVRVFTPEGMKEFKLDMEKMKSLGKDGEFKMFSPEGMKEFKLDMEKMKSLHDKDLHMLDEKARGDMEKAFQKAHEEMLRSGDSMKISRKAMEDARKEMEKAMKEHGNFKGRAFVMPDHEGLFKVMPHGGGKNFEFRVGKDGRSPFTMGIDGKSFTKFMDSLSNDQREKNRRQGYLRASELTESQRKMLGVSGREKGWSITINKDGQSVTVKSND